MAYMAVDLDNYLNKKMCFCNCAMGDNHVYNLKKKSIFNVYRYASQ